MLGVMIAFTYEKTSRTVDRPDHFLQALILITVVASTIIQAIGDSVARGLGMLGALSIIRFRTTVRDPRNIVFMFGAIASGIACGVFGFLIAIVGTVTFCITAFILRYSPFAPAHAMLGVLTIEVHKDFANLDEVEEKTIGRYCERFELERYKAFTSEKKTDLYLYEYTIKLKPQVQLPELARAMNELPAVTLGNLTFKKRVWESI